MLPQTDDDKFLKRFMKEFKRSSKKTDVPEGIRAMRKKEAEEARLAAAMVSSNKGYKLKTEPLQKPEPTANEIAIGLARAIATRPGYRLNV